MSTKIRIRKKMQATQKVRILFLVCSINIIVLLVSEFIISVSKRTCNEKFF